LIAVAGDERDAFAITGKLWAFLDRARDVDRDHRPGRLADRGGDPPDAERVGAQVHPHGEEARQRYSGAGDSSPWPARRRRRSHASRRWWAASASRSSRRSNHRRMPAYR
jgi:hypothetical protein